MYPSETIARTPPAHGKVDESIRIIAPQHVHLAAVLRLFHFHPPSVLTPPAKNARKAVKEAYQNECKANQVANKTTCSLFGVLASKEEWGFVEHETIYHPSKQDIPHRYVPFSQLRDWLLAHLDPQEEEQPSVRQAIESFPYAEFAAKMAKEWQALVADDLAKINRLKRAYDTFVDQTGTPVEQQPWVKKQRVVSENDA